MDDTHIENTSPNGEVFSDVERDDELFMNELMKRGVSPSITAPRYSAKELSRSLYDAEFDEELEAEEYVNRAIELYWIAYEDRLEGAAEEARRIIAKYPGHFKQDGQPIIDAQVIWDKADEAHIRFMTEESAMLDSVQGGVPDDSTENS